MRKILFLLTAILMFFAVFAGEAKAANQDIWVKVTSPNGGETLTVGQPYTITWESSENVDKVSIGYSFGPGSLNWIEFTTANTKSYTWNVNIGNTTNTQVKIDITGYYTGYGSGTDQSDGYFTVVDPNKTPTPTSTPRPTNTPYPTATPYVKPTTGATQVYTTTPIQVNNVIQPVVYQTNVLSITNINIWQVFVFNGSQTTNLKSVPNPRKVENYTLDTQLGYKFVFTKTLDFSKQNTLKAVEAIKDDWVIEEGSLWIKAEWWERYKLVSPVEVTYKNEKLTDYPPIIKDQVKNSIGTGKPGYEVLGVSKDEVKLNVKGETKIVIEPNVTIEGEDTRNIDNLPLVLKGKTSHKDLYYLARVNGRTVPVEVKKQGEENGDLELELYDIDKGNNYVQLYYAVSKDKAPVEIKAVKVNYEPKFIEKVKDRIALIMIGTSCLVLGLAMPRIYKMTKVEMKKRKKLAARRKLAAKVSKATINKKKVK